MLAGPPMPGSDIVCLSHVPWEQGLERPAQIMRRFARDRHVFFVEDPIVQGAESYTTIRSVEPNVHVVSTRVPQRDRGSRGGLAAAAHRSCVSSLATSGSRPILWVYSPLAFSAAQDLQPSLLVYDCIADHAARRHAPADLRASERDVLARADLVFTAGTALFEAKREANLSTYPLPSSVEVEHFAGMHDALATRGRIAARAPRVGFLGPIDDRVDLALVDTLAVARPDVQIMLVGGLVDVAYWDLPDRPNVHWLGARAYAELPHHLASWDAAIIPFHTDAATRKTEPSGLLPYLAADLPVVSTPLDELGSYARAGIVDVATPRDFVHAVGHALEERASIGAARQAARRDALARTSWDRTCQAMTLLVGDAVRSAGRRPRPGVLDHTDTDHEGARNSSTSRAALVASPLL